MKNLVGIMALLGLFFIVPSAAAQEPTPESPTVDEVNEVAQDLYCPVCQNVPLDVCGTQACADWREEIREMLAAGATEEEVRQSFADRYGRRVLATPESSSFDAWLWVLPIVGVIAGGVVFGVGLRRLAPEALLATPDARAYAEYGDLDPEYVERVEDDLKEFTL